MADILIKGMEMPKYCAVCPLRVDGLHTFQCVRLLGRAYTYELEEQRQEDCPLVEIPEHGELIDRKALFDSIVADIQGVNTEGCYDDDEVELIRTTYQAVLYKLQNESPVIVEATE